MLAGLSPDIRQLLYKQVSEAQRNQPVATISTQPSGGDSASAGPGPSTVEMRVRDTEGSADGASRLNCMGASRILTVAFVFQQSPRRSVARRTAMAR